MADKWSKTNPFPIPSIMVNILDIDGEKVKEFIQAYRDKCNNPNNDLELLFKVQEDLMKMYNIKVLPLNSREGQEQIKTYIYYLVEEIFEFANLLKSRPWTKTLYDPDVNRIKDEIADAIAFFVQILYLLKFNHKDVVDLFSRKMLVNQFRIKSNY